MTSIILPRPMVKYSYRSPQSPDFYTSKDTELHRGNFVGINWQPDFKNYLGRPPTLAQQLPSMNNACPGWPTSLTSPLVWDGEELKNKRNHIYELNLEEKADIYEALKHFRGLCMNYSFVTKDTFPLPRLGPVLEQLAADLHHGRGFFVVRGIDPSHFSLEDNALLYLGISSYVAPRRGRNNPTGQMITQIIQPSDELAAEAKTQPIYSSLRQPFHADVVCDVLALYTKSVPATGGEHFLASSWHIYNALAASRPDLLATLSASDWIHNTFNDEEPHYRKPLLFLNKSQQPILNFSRRMITGNEQFPRPKDAPPITSTQAEALDAVHFIADNSKVQLEAKAGDITFVNNLAILHCRAAFKDSDSAKRHVLRMWLRNDKLAWDIPEGLRDLWEDTYGSKDHVPEDWDLTRPFKRLGKSDKCG